MPIATRLEMTAANPQGRGGGSVPASSGASVPASGGASAGGPAGPARQAAPRVTVPPPAERHAGAGRERTHGLARVVFRRGGRVLLETRCGLVSKRRRREVFARELRLAFEELGPAFVKIGQLMSVRPDVFPAELVFELSQLRDAVAPLPFDVVRGAVEREFGRSLEHLYAEFDPVPVASASIAQVHRAILSEPARPVWGEVLPAGTEVAVKVVRPGIEAAVLEDLRLARRVFARLRRLRSFRRWNADALLEEFARSLDSELDLRNEGRTADRFAFDFRDDLLVKVPRIVWSRTTAGVLTMEFLPGWRLSELDDARRAGVDAYGLAVHGAEVFMRQVLVFGRYHADLHPANLFVTPDNRIAYLDFGIMGRLAREERKMVGEMLAALVYRDAHKALECSRALGVEVPADRVAAITEELGRLMGRTLAPSGGPGQEDGGRGDGLPPDVGRRPDVRDFGMGFLSLLGRHGIEVPAGYGLLVKALVTVEGVSRALYPDIDIIEAARPFVTRLLLEKAGRPRDVAARAARALRAALAELVA